MTIPTKEEAGDILNSYVTDEYQRYHAEMVATAMAGYAELFGEDENLWYVTGLLHDLDFEKHPDTHPRESLKWFQGWGYPEELIHAVEAHAYGHNGFQVLPKSKLAQALMACDELCGIFYAYKKINPIPFSQMKTKSIIKRFNEKTFAAKIKREDIIRGCDLLEITLEDHIKNMINHLSALDH